VRAADPWIWPAAHPLTVLDIDDGNPARPRGSGVKSRIDVSAIRRKNGQVAEGSAPGDRHGPEKPQGLARAAAVAGDLATSRQAYEDFLKLWKDADSDLPILIAAKQEYARLTP
jgi:hypothetical protein